VVDNLNVGLRDNANVDTWFAVATVPRADHSAWSGSPMNETQAEK